MKKFLFTISLLLMISSVCYAKVEIPDTIRVKLNDGTIETVDFDEYLYAVVSCEMGTSYKDNGKSGQIGLEALKSQAVASRSYAISNLHPNNDYDVVANTGNQTYKVVDVADIVKKAVDETRGEVMTYDGKVICAYFGTCSGGHTESPENVWSSALPYLVGVKDPYEIYVEGRNEWEAKIPYDKYGEIKILERDENDRVISLKVGDKTLSKNNIRTTLGTSLIKSTWFDVEYDKSTDEYIFTGKGYGHGVGMSQYGAIGMAEEGFSYDEILNWYYTDIEIVSTTTSNSQKSTHEVKEEKNAEETKTIDKNYSDSNVEVKEEKKIEIVETPKGPLLLKILNIINNSFLFNNLGM